MLPIIDQVANEYKANLQSLYGDELAELVLFGSYARGDYHDESDIDFALHTSLQKKQTSMQGVYQDIRKEGIII
jgi:uncharacterized protein